MQQCIPVRLTMLLAMDNVVRGLCDRVDGHGCAAYGTVGVFPCLVLDTLYCPVYGRNSLHPKRLLYKKHRHEGHHRMCASSPS